MKLFGSSAEIDQEFAQNYFYRLNTGAGANQPDPMANINNFSPEVYGMWKRAEHRGEMETLCQVMAFYIVNPDGISSLVSPQGYPFSDSELQEIFKYAFKIIWPDRYTFSSPNDSDD